MSNKKSLDPFEMWRDMFAKFEETANAAATDSLQSELFKKGFGPLSLLSAELKQNYSKALDSYFKALNLPSRDEITAIEERLQRIEDKIDLLTPIEHREPPESRPRRTRKPPAPKGDEAKKGETKS